MGTPKSERLAQIVLDLRAQYQPTTVDSLADRFNVTRRTIFHDISTLRADGLQIDGVPARGGGLTLIDPSPTASSNVQSQERLANAFFGREQEISELTLALEHASDGHTGLIMLAGEAGIGKTRLLREFGARTGRIGVVSVWGRCQERDGSPPYWPWIGVLRTLVELQPTVDQLRHTLGTGASVIAELIPEIRQHLPEQPAAPAEADMSSDRFRLFDAVSKFLTSCADTAPLILVLDDLQWADEPSLMMLEFIAREATDARVLVVGTYRTDELSRRRTFLNTLAELTRSGNCQRIGLRGLAPIDVESFIKAVSGSHASAELIDTVSRRSEGNPLFMRELLRWLMTESSIDANSSEHESDVITRVPESIREVIGQHLDRLSDRCNATLSVAAVMGRYFTLDQVNAVIPGTRSRILEDLDEATAGGIIEEVSSPTVSFQFSHVLFRETIEQELSAAQRVQLHYEIGEALEALYDEDAEAHADELAYHFFEAQALVRTEKLVRYLLIAGESALSTYAWEEALTLFERGLAVKEHQATDDDGAALLFGLARAQTKTLERYRIHESVDTARRAFDYYVSAGDSPRAISIAIYPFYSEIGDTKTRMLAEALELVPPDSHSAGRILARYGAGLSRELGKFESAVTALNRALEIAQREDDSVLETAVLASLADTHWMMHLNPQECLKYSLRAIEIGSHSHTEPDHGGNWWAVVGFIATGDFELAETHARNHSELIEKRGGRFAASQALHASETLAHLRGDWESAQDYSDRGLEVGQRDARLISNRIALEYERGRFSQGDHYLERLIETMRLSPPGTTLDYSILPLAVGMDARITGRNRKFDIARAAADTALSAQSDVAFYTQLARTGLALLAVVQGDEASAKEQYDILKPLGITLTPLNLMCGHRVLGLLAQTMGRMDDAIAHFEDSLAFCRKAGARPELAWTSHDYAGALLQRDEPADYSKASSLVKQALTISTALGMRPLSQRVKNLLETIRSQPARSPASPAGLSPREVEVLRLVASGKSNAQIAAELVLSVRTVERHISNIYSKTGSGGRANATAFAFTNGLMSST